MQNKKTILDSLYTAADAAYRNFSAKIIPTITHDKFIGVRTPKIRSMAHNMIKSDEYNDFIHELPHKYFDENQLHAFIISEFHDFDTAINAVNKFLPYVDNWATCDQMSPKTFAKNTNKLLPHIKKWIKSKHVYTVRFAVLCLMRYFMDTNFDKKYADIVLGINTDEYYINMMRAWYFATAAAKHFDKVYSYFSKLDSWTRTHAIQKATESYRVLPEHKVKLRALRGKL